jgi:hypothetical protein
MLGEFAEREGWAVSGMLSCAHWASWRLGLTLTTARERVRVAWSLRSLPEVSTALGEGRLSYAQARAITRVATSADEHTWVDLSRHTTAAQLEKATRGVARSRKNQARRDNPELVDHQDRARMSWDDDGSLSRAREHAARGTLPRKTWPSQRWRPSSPTCSSSRTTPSTGPSRNAACGPKRSLGAVRPGTPPALSANGSRLTSAPSGYPRARPPSPMACSTP